MRSNKFDFQAPDALKIIQQKLKQLKVIHLTDIISFKILAKEISVKETELLGFFQDKLNTLVILGMIKKKDKQPTAGIQEIYLEKKFNPRLLEYGEGKLRIDLYDNYGNIHGAYVCPDEGVINTPEKIDAIISKYKLTKPASYILGAWTDTSTIKPKGGFEINLEILEQLEKEFKIVNSVESIQKLKDYWEAERESKR